MEKKIYSLAWNVEIKSSFDIIELWNIISNRVLWGAHLSWIEKCIYDEVPAIYLWNLLWMKVILSGYKWLVWKVGYCLAFQSIFHVEKENNIQVNFSQYIHALCKKNLESEDIKILPIMERNL